MNIENEQFISIDTNQTIMEEADTLMEEYEQQKIDQLKGAGEGAGRPASSCWRRWEACCIATQGKKKAFCECFQHNSRPCLDMEGVCWFGEKLVIAIFGKCNPESEGQG